MHDSSVECYLRVTVQFTSSITTFLQFFSHYNFSYLNEWMKMNDHEMEKWKEERFASHGWKCLLPHQLVVLRVTFITINQAFCYSFKLSKHFATRQCFSQTKITQDPHISRHSLSSLQFKLGTSLKLFCEAEGNPPPIITWYKNDAELRTDPRITVGDSRSLE